LPSISGIAHDVCRAELKRRVRARVGYCKTSPVATLQPAVSRIVAGKEEGIYEFTLTAICRDAPYDKLRFLYSAKACCILYREFYASSGVTLKKAE
jgi:hypothetical protein